MNAYYLSHHGIEGQKWGVRNGPPYPLDSGKKNKSKKDFRLTESQKKALLIGSAAIATVLAGYGAYKTGLISPDISLKVSQKIWNTKMAVNKKILKTRIKISNKRYEKLKKRDAARISRERAKSLKRLAKYSM